MIKVSQKCETLDEGIKFLMHGAKADYVRMSTNNGLKELSGYSLEQTDNWDKKQKSKKVRNTSKLYKILVFFVLS